MIGSEPVYLLRAICGFVALVGFVGLTLRGYAYARLATRWRRRVFWITALLTIGLWDVVIAIQSFVLLYSPRSIPPSSFPAVLQTFLSVSVAIGSIILWRFCPRPGDER